MRVLIFGAKGWLGGQYIKFFKSVPEVQALASFADVTDYGEVQDAMATCNPDWVINAAGVTRGRKFNNIDGCEEDKAAKERTTQVNVDGAMNVARICAAFESRLVHLSSGNIFNGHPFGGFREEAEPTPLNHYYWTKAEAERQLLEYWKSGVLILRAQLPVNDEVNPRNLIYKLSHAREVADVTNSVTVLEDLMVATRKLMKRRTSGVFNIVNPQPISYRELVEMYCHLVNPNHAGKYRLVKDLKTQTPRSNAVLSTEKLHGEGIYLTQTQAAIRQCLEGYARNLRMFSTQAV